MAFTSRAQRTPSIRSQNDRDRRRAGYITCVDLSMVSVMGALARLAMMVAGSRHGQRPAR